MGLLGRKTELGVGWTCEVGTSWSAARWGVPETIEGNGQWISAARSGPSWLAEDDLATPLGVASVGPDTHWPTVHCDPYSIETSTR